MDERQIGTLRQTCRCIGAPFQIGKNMAKVRKLSPFVRIQKFFNTLRAGGPTISLSSCFLSLFLCLLSSRHLSHLWHLWLGSIFPKLWPCFLRLAWTFSGVLLSFSFAFVFVRELLPFPTVVLAVLFGLFFCRCRLPVIRVWTARATARPLGTFKSGATFRRK